MLKRTLLAATAALMTCASASAFTLSCGAPVVAVGDDPRDGNPVTAIGISYKPENSAWAVVYQFRDGTKIVRNNQYAMRDASVPGRKVQWRGTLYRQPVIWMIGEVKRDGDAITYYEWMYNSDKGNALLMHSAARCVPYNPVPQPTAEAAPTQPYAQAPEVKPAPQAPQPTQQPPAPGTASLPVKDSVPLILSSDGRQMKIDVILGGMPLRMIVDTGATSSTITASFASMLLRNGNAVELGEVTARYANGSTGRERVLRVKEMRIGSHVLRDVLVSVSEGMTLLGFDAMNAIGPFTIDARAGEIIWHVKRG
jgi:hypothetical protein